MELITYTDIEGFAAHLSGKASVDGAFLMVGNETISAMADGAELARLSMGLTEEAEEWIRGAGFSDYEMTTLATSRAIAKRSIDILPVDGGVVPDQARAAHRLALVGPEDAIAAAAMGRGAFFNIKIPIFEHFEPFVILMVLEPGSSRPVYPAAHSKVMRGARSAFITKVKQATGLPVRFGERNEAR